MEVLAVSAVSALSDSAVAQARQLRTSLGALSALNSRVQEQKLDIDMRQAELLEELRALQPEIDKWVRSG